MKLTEEFKERILDYVVPYADCKKDDLKPDFSDEKMREIARKIAKNVMETINKIHDEEFVRSIRVRDFEKANVVPLESYYNEQYKKDLIDEYLYGKKIVFDHVSEKLFNDNKGEFNGS